MTGLYCFEIQLVVVWKDGWLIIAVDNYCLFIILAVDCFDLEIDLNNYLLDTVTMKIRTNMLLEGRMMTWWFFTLFA